MKFLCLIIMAFLSLSYRMVPTGEEHKNLDKLPNAKSNIKCFSNQTQIKRISSKYGVLLKREAPTGEEHKNLDKLPNSESSIKCPSNHTQIKLISGYRAFPTRCGVLAKETEICAKCIYVYNRRDRYWEREGTKVNDFKIALSPLISSVHTILKKGVIQNVGYHQMWKKGYTHRESVESRSSEGYLEALKKIKAFLKKNKIDYSKASETEKTFKLKTKYGKYDLVVSLGKYDVSMGLSIYFSISDIQGLFEIRRLRK